MIKLFSDGADYEGIITASKDPKISGFTTNPTLMKQAGVTNYEDFSKKIIAHLKTYRPETCLSLEVFADDTEEMYQQAKKVYSWANNYNLFIKIPVMNTRGNPNYNLIKRLSDEGIPLNVTAVFTIHQINRVYTSLNEFTPSIVSIFAGRIADAGNDPVDIVRYAVEMRNENIDRKAVQFLWASPREAFNYIQANDCGCDIITMTPDLIKKVKGFGKDLTQFSLETCQMFYNDAVSSGFKI